MEEQLSESSAKVAEYESTITAMKSTQAKLQTENNDLSTQLGEAESNVGSLTKTKQSLSSQVEELKSDLESESSVSRWKREQRFSDLLKYYSRYKSFVMGGKYIEWPQDIRYNNSCFIVAVAISPIYRQSLMHCRSSSLSRVSMLNYRRPWMKRWMPRALCRVNSPTPSLMQLPGGASTRLRPHPESRSWRKPSE